MRIFAVLLLLLTAAVQADPGPRYVGFRYEKSPALAAILSQVPAARQKALAAIEANLGLHYADAGTIEIILDDTGAGPGHLGSTSMDDHPKVYIFLHSVFEGRADFQEIVTHEMTHAIMRELLGKEAESLPLWLMEGLAVYASDGGSPRVNLMVMRAAAPRVVLDGLEGKAHIGYDYAEDFLALDRMRRKYGPEAVRKMTQLVMKRVPYKDAVQQATGEKWEQFVSDSYDFAASTVDELPHWTRPNLRKAQKALTEGQFDIAMSIYDEMLKEGTEQDVRSYPRFYKGICLMALGRHDEAQALFESVSKSKFLVPEGLLYLGHCAALQGRADEALKYYLSIQERFPASYRVPAALFHAAHLLEAKGRKAEADALRAQLRTTYSLSVYNKRNAPQLFMWAPEMNPQSVGGPLGF